MLSLKMHQHQTSSAKCRYQSRALSASPSPPPIPPQPDFIQYKKPLPSFDVPPPPPRCYQLIPIRESTINQKISRESPKMQSLTNASVGRRSFNQHIYKNVQGGVEPTFVVKDPRRKPYYYNELSQSLDADLVDQNSNVKSNSTKFEQVDDEIKQSSTIPEISASNYGSGGSLDHIF